MMRERSSFFGRKPIKYMLWIIIFLGILYLIFAEIIGFRYTKYKASKGDAESQFVLAQNYYLGNGGFEQNYSEALHWVSLSASQGNSDALYSICVVASPQIRTDTTTCVEKIKNDIHLLWAALAQGAINLKEFKLAKSYLSKVEGEPKIWAELNSIKVDILTEYANTSPKEIMDKISALSAKKVATAQYIEILLKLANVNFTENTSEFSKIVLSNIDIGPGEANFRLAQLIQEKKINSDLTYFQVLENAANGGHKQAALMLADHYSELDQTKESQKIATKWYMIAAKYGDPIAAHNIGVRYLSGTGGLEVSDLEAIKWFTLASKSNFAPSINSLGTMYYFGRGVEKDVEMATELFERSVDLNDENAKFNLASILINMDSPNRELGLQYLSDLTKLGHVQATQLLQEKQDALQ